MTGGARSWSFVLISGWFLYVVLIGLVIPRLGSTHALLTSTLDPRSVSFATMSGDAAFLVMPVVSTPYGVDLGTWETGQEIELELVAWVQNNTANAFGSRRKTLTVEISLVQTSAATLDVFAFPSPATLAPGPPGQIASVLISGTAGSVPGQIAGYMRISSLNGFLTLDIPITGTVVPAPEPLAQLESIDADTELVPEGEAEAAPSPSLESDPPTSAGSEGS